MSSAMTELRVTRASCCSSQTWSFSTSPLERACRAARLASALCPLDPGRGRTKTGYLWAIARDDRPWGGREPPAIAYTYAPGRGAEHAATLLAGFSGTLQVDGYAGYDRQTDATRLGGPLVLAYCWSHFRRRFYDIA